MYKWKFLKYTREIPDRVNNTILEIRNLFISDIGEVDEKPAQSHNNNVRTRLEQRSEIFVLLTLNMFWPGSTYPMFISDVNSQ